MELVGCLVWLVKVLFCIEAGVAYGGVFCLAIWFLVSAPKPAAIILGTGGLAALACYASPVAAQAIICLAGLGGFAAVPLAMARR